MVRQSGRHIAQVDERIVPVASASPPMPKSVFISYNYRQADWVRDRLLSRLKAGGADAIIHRERFTAATGAW
jgi:hypothetical protein